MDTQQENCAKAVNRTWRCLAGDKSVFKMFNETFTFIKQHICMLEGNCSHCLNTGKGARGDVTRREEEQFVRPKVIRRQLNQSHHAMKSKLSESKNTSTVRNFQRRFHIALTEINRRLVSQNQLWSSLDNRYKVDQ